MVDTIGSMTLEEQIRVKEDTQRVLQSINFNQFTVHEGDAQFDFYAATMLGSARKRVVKKKAELRTAYDTIGLTSQLSTAKGGKPKAEIRAIKDMTAFALVTVDDGDSVHYTARVLSKSKPIDIKLVDAETSISIRVVEPSAFLTQVETSIANSRATPGATSGVNTLKAPGGRRSRGRPKQASFLDRVLEPIRRNLKPNSLVKAYLLLASIWFVYRHVESLYTIRELGVEAILCKDCYAKNVYSAFQQNFYYLFIVISLLGYVYVATHIVRTWSSGPYPRFAAFEVFRLTYDFTTEIYIYYTLPHQTRTLLNSTLFKARVRSHFFDAFVVLLLLWNPKHKTGYKSLLRNAFGALLISFLMESTYFYYLSALHAKLVPGVDFLDWYDIEYGFIDATEGLYDRLEDTVPRDELEHLEL